jgi:hypothetical protein
MSGVANNRPSSSIVEWYPFIARGSALGAPAVTGETLQQ